MPMSARAPLLTHLISASIWTRFVFLLAVTMISHPIGYGFPGSFDNLVEFTSGVTPSVLRETRGPLCCYH